jgi:hypothetical protein
MLVGLWCLQICFEVLAVERDHENVGGHLNVVPVIAYIPGVLLLVEQKNKTRYEIKITVMRVHCPTLRLQGSLVSRYVFVRNL